MVMTGIYWSDFLYQLYTIYILFEFYLGWDMQSISLNSKTYTCSISSIYFLLLWMYLVYTWDMATSGISCSRMSQPWFEFPTRSHITYNSWIWLIFRSCLQNAGSYLRCCHIYGIYCIRYGISYIYLSSFDTWGYPWYIPCIWHLKIHILWIWHAYTMDMTVHKRQASLSMSYLLDILWIRYW